MVIIKHIINIKKSLLKITLLLGIVVVIFMMLQMITRFQSNEILQIEISEEIVKCLSSEIPAMQSTYYKFNNSLREDGEEQEETFAQKILRVELAQINNIREIENVNSNIEDNEKKEEISASTEEVATNETTEIVTNNPIKENYNIEVNGVKIKNETSFEIDESILDTELNINKENIVIFHTHTCESYTPTEQFNYEQTGNFRTTDLNYSVVRVGEELTQNLVKYGFNVNHDKTYHDYPAYTGSYTRSKATVESVLASTPSDIIIDLHRDAIGSKSDYDPSVKIGDETVAQLMFVIGTNGGGLYHPDWQSNLKFAIEVQEKANEMYPGLFKTMIVRNSRYNQHLGKAACIIEVGATGNTLEQSMASMKYLAKVLEEYKK